MNSDLVPTDSDEQRLVSAYIEALSIVQKLDDAQARCLWEDCEAVEHRGQEVYCLKSLPGRYLNVMQFTALEDCLFTRVFPSRPPRITIPFAYEEAVRLL